MSATIIPLKYFSATDAPPQGNPEVFKSSFAIISDDTQVLELFKALMVSYAIGQSLRIYRNVEDAKYFLLGKPVSAVFIDVGLPGVSSMEVLIELKARMLSSDFCLIAMQELQYGTSALSTTSVYSESLFAILHNLLNRDEETFMRQRQANCGIDNLTLDSNEVNIRLQLTPRRCEILELLSQGLLYKEISSTLGITLGTVKQHVHKIYHTLQVSNKIEAVNLYREHS